MSTLHDSANHILPSDNSDTENNDTWYLIYSNIANTVPSAATGDLVFDQVGENYGGLALDDVELSTNSGASSTPLNENLIVNPGAESPTGANYGFSVVPDGWTTTSNFSAVRYDAGHPEDLNTQDAATVNGGNNYFAGGPSNATATATQTIDFADLATQIDSASLQAELSAYLGGWASQGDNMTVSAIFYDQDRQQLASVSLDPVLPNERDNTSQLLSRSETHDIPVGARSVDIVLVAQRTGGAYNDGYADNLDFRIISRSTPPDELITGTNSRDTLIGSSGNDTIIGLRGSDELVGNSGDDTLVGGYGDDILEGGAGKDAFVFDTGGRFRSREIGIDTIVDFEDSDQIVLDKTTFAKLTSGAVSFARVTSSDRAQTRSALITYDRSRGMLYYNENGQESGFGTGGQFAILSDRPSLTASDFVVQA